MKKVIKISSFLCLLSLQMAAHADERGYPEIDPSTLQNQCPGELNSALKHLGFGLAADGLREGIEHRVVLIEQGETSSSSWPAMKIDRFFDPIKKTGMNVKTYFEQNKKVITSSFSFVSGESSDYPNARNTSEAEQLLVYPQQLLIELNPDCSPKWITSINNEKEADGYSRPNVYFSAEFCKNLGRLVEDKENKSILVAKDIGWIQKSDLKEAESMCKRAEVVFKK